MAQNERVLILVMNSVPDCEIERDCDWYCIPVQSPFKRWQRMRLAYKQVKVSAEEGRAVNCCAMVLNYSGVPRSAPLRLQDDHPWAHGIHPRYSLEPLPSVER